MEKGLVSILTPCYNTGDLLSRLLDSILMQDYPFVEMFAIDDGSSDNTSKVIKEYIPRFAGRGYQLTYIHQDNSGQSVAINRGLKLIKGEYLVWPDSDDFYSTPCALSKMVDVLQGTDDSVSIVRCLAEFIDESSLQVVNKYLPTEQTDWFEDCLFARPNSWYCPGGYMAKVKLLDETIQNRDIYTQKDAGQNWQLLLPLLYERKCITINEYHYKILCRGTSHSRGQYKTYEELIRKIQSYEKTIVSTLGKINSMPVESRNQYIRDIKIKYLHECYGTCWIFLRRRDALMIQKELKECYGVCIPLYERIRMDLLWLYKKVRRVIRRIS